MIPVQLTINGLYSYQKKQTIEFQPLMEGQVFGIFGPVGSGKSSILEAICFALYNETERLLKKGDNRNYNMMNLKSDALLIDFIFRNFDDEQFRFIVKGKRRGTDFNAVPKFSRTAYKKVKNNEGEEWLPIEDVNAEDILGMSYENFRRTIIIPQGKFQEFLQLGDSARTNMLKELFQLGKFEFFRQTASLQKKNTDALNILIGELKRFQEIDKKTLKTHKDLAKSTEKELNAEKKMLAESEVKEAEQKNLKQKFNELSQNELALQRLTEKKTEIERLKKLVKDFEVCQSQFKSNIDLQKDAKQNSQSKYALVVKETDQYEKLIDHLSSREKDYEKAKEKFSKIEELKNEIFDLNILATIARKKKTSAENESEYNKRLKTLKVLKQKRADHAEKLDAEKTALKALKTSMPDTWDLAEIDSWFKTKNLLKTQLEQQSIALKKKKNDLLNFRTGWWQSFDDQINKQLSSTDRGPSPAHLESIKSLTEDHSRQMELGSKNLDNIRLHAKMEEFKHNLKPGEDCPLCGSTEHPNINKKEDLDEILTKAEKDFEQQKRYEQALISAKQIIEKSIAEDNLHSVNITETELALKSLQTELDQQFKSFIWQGFDPENEETFQKRLSELKNAGEKIKSKEAVIEQYESTLRDLESELNGLEKSVNQAKSEKEASETEIKTLFQQLKILNPIDFPAGPEQLSHLIEDLEKEVAGIDKSFHDLQKEVNELSRYKANAKGTIDQLKKEAKENEKRLTAITETINTAIEDSTFKSLEEVKTILNQNLDIQTEKSKIKAFDQQFFKLNEDIKLLKTNLKGRNFDDAAYQNLIEANARHKEKIQQLNDTLVKLKSEIERLEKDLQEKAELESRKTVLDNRGEDLRKLYNLFKGGGFVNFISSVYLDNLCEAANVRFSKLTRQQLRLQINDTNNFEVKDFLNDGRTRSVKTLSGGQTFQAALSLALALADSVQEQNKARQNFFFLDEGFGSLDRESLQTVFETLKQLRKENRIVGVISHVEDLQQEIDVFLKIDNDPEKGSMISRSWTS